MKALVTTSKAVVAVDTDGNNETITPIHEGLGLYAGVTRHDGDIVVAARRRATDDESGPEHGNECLIHFSVEKNRVSVREPAIRLRDIHGIASIDGALWCTCSYDNGIAIFRERVASMVFPLGRPDVPPFDVNHINSVSEIDGRVFIVCHNRGESAVCEIDRDTFDVVNQWSIGIHAHDVWFDGDQLRTFSSGEGYIVGLDGFRKKVGGFPRGHTRVGEHRLIGVTKHNVRAERDESTSTLLVTDVEYRIQREIELPHHGMLLDLIEITEAEYAFLTA